MPHGLQNTLQFQAGALPVAEIKVLCTAERTQLFQQVLAVLMSVSWCVHGKHNRASGRGRAGQQGAEHVGEGETGRCRPQGNGLPIRQHSASNTAPPPPLPSPRGSLLPAAGQKTWPQWFEYIL